MAEPLCLVYSELGWPLILLEPPAAVLAVVSVTSRDLPAAAAFSSASRQVLASCRACCYFCIKRKI